jgi:uncharacterized peroxidase-related enzyme
MSRFASHTKDTAPAAARAMLVASERQFGFVPSPVAKLAGSPVALQHLLAGFDMFDRTGLSTVEREVVAMTVAYETGCHYCMAMHSAMLQASPELVAALRGGRALSDPRLEPLRELARAIVVEHGRVGAPVWERFVAAGFTHAQALDVLLGVGVYLLSTLGNNLTGVELDAAFATFAWSRS